MAAETDPGSPDFQWPEVKDLRPADAGRLLDEIERQASAANKRADLLKSRKAQAKQIVNAVLEEYELDALPFTSNGGQRVRYTPYPFDAFHVSDEKAFKEWVAGEAESYYDSTPRLREDVFRDAMRRRVQDGEPLPPGVTRFTDTRLSRTAVTKAPK